MSRYYDMREYDCPADYYDAGNLGSRSPESIRRQRKYESDERQRERDKVSDEMRRHQELYGD